MFYVAFGCRFSAMCATATANAAAAAPETCFFSLVCSHPLAFTRTRSLA